MIVGRRYAVSRQGLALLTGSVLVALVWALSGGVAQAASPWSQMETEIAARYGDRAPETTDMQRAKATLEVLDMDELEASLRRTDAIDLFTKIKLKFRLESLLGAFYRLHHGAVGPDSADLSARFDALMDQTLALLRDGDRPLFRKLTASRQALWQVMIDPVKFAAAELYTPYETVDDSYSNR